MGTDSQVNFCAATNNFWEISGVQFELGSQATPVEHEPFTVTLERCKRYYQRSKDYGANANARDTWNTAEGSMSQTKHNSYFDIYQMFPVQMRINPSMTFRNTSGGTNGLRLEEPGVTNFEINKSPNDLNTKETGYHARYNISSSNSSHGAARSGSGNMFARVTWEADAAF